MLSFFSATNVPRLSAAKFDQIITAFGKAEEKLNGEKFFSNEAASCFKSSTNRDKFATKNKTFQNGRFEDSKENPTLYCAYTTTAARCLGLALDQIP